MTYLSEKKQLQQNSRSHLRDKVIYYLEDVPLKEKDFEPLTLGQKEAYDDILGVYENLAGITFNGFCREKYFEVLVNKLRRDIKRNNVPYRQIPYPLELRLDESPKDIVGKYEFDENSGYWVPAYNKGDGYSWYMGINTEFFEKANDDTIKDNIYK